MATESLNLSVKSDSVEKATKRLDKFGKEAKEATKATDKLADEQTRGAKATDKLGDETHQTTEQLKKNTKATRENNAARESSNKSLGRSLLAFGGATAALYAIGRAGKFAVQAAADMETLETSFISITGSAEEATKTIKILTEFTASTPFQLDGVAAAAKQLVTAKGDTEGLTDELQVLGDISATVGVPIQELAAIYTKAFNKGKIQAEELNQISERGIPIIRILAEQYGVTTAEIFEMGSQGKLSFEDLQTAFRNMTEDGGLAFGAMERQSETMNGKLSTLSDNLKLIASDIGGIINEALDLKSVASGITELVGAAREWLQINDRLHEIRKDRAAQEKTITGLLEKQVELAELILFNEQALADEVLDGQIAARQDILDTLNSELDDVRELLSLHDETEVALERQKMELSDLSIFLRQNKDVSDSMTDILWEQVDAYKEQVKVLAERKAFNDTFNEIPGEGEDTLPSGIYDDEKKKTRSSSPRRATGGSGSSRPDPDAERRASQLDLDILFEGKQMELAMLDEFYAERHALIMENETVTEEEKTRLVLEETKRRNADAEKIEREYQERKLAAASDTFGNLASIAEAFGEEGAAAAKGFAITQATIDSYRAYNAALADATVTSTVARQIMAGVALAAGLANVAKIASAGNYAEGGIIPGQSYTGDNLTANVNSSEMIINRSQQARLFDIANGRGTQGGKNETTVNVVNLPGQSAEVQETNGPNGKTVEVIITRAKNEIAQEISTGAGVVSQAFESSYRSLKRG